MKKILFSSVVMIILSLWALNCHKDPAVSIEPAEPIVNLPTEVNLGESIVYLNCLILLLIPYKSFVIWSKI